MISNLKIAFVGAGAMGEAMITGLLSQKLIAPESIMAADPREEQGELLRSKYGIRVTTENKVAVDKADVVVLAVKPQVLAHISNDLKGCLAPHSMVLSIIAGATIKSISQGLAHSSVARSMPNTPAQIGEGITVWTVSPEVTELQHKQAETILGALGQQVFVDDEDYLDMATAVSGTGPAYVFLFMEAMVDAGVHLGFSRQVSEQLVLQTIKGSAEYAMKSPNHLARLRNQVTSPGGTSAEAIYYLEKAGFRTAISRAVWAAYQRSVQLGKGKKRSELRDEK